MDDNSGLRSLKVVYQQLRYLFYYSLILNIQPFVGDLSHFLPALQLNLFFCHTFDKVENVSWPARACCIFVIYFCHIFVSCMELGRTGFLPVHLAGHLTGFTECRSLCCTSPTTFSVISSILCSSDLFVYI